MTKITTAEIAQTMAALQQQVESLKSTLAETNRRLARGTSDVTAAARLAAGHIVPLPVVETPTERVARAMRGVVSTPESLALDTDLDPDTIRKIVAGFGDAVYNTATDARPRWVLRIGDDTDTEELLEAVRRLLRERPMELRECVEATGARRNRVSGAIVKLQAQEEPVTNLGTGNRARWFLVQPQPRG